MIDFNRPALVGNELKYIQEIRFLEEKRPETLLRIALPVGLKFVLKFVFKAAKDYPKECEATRKDIDRRLSAALKEWTAD